MGGHMDSTYALLTDGATVEIRPAGRFTAETLSENAAMPRGDESACWPRLPLGHGLLGFLRSVRLPGWPIISGANGLWGAKWGANAGGHRATPGHSELWFPQLDRLSGPGQPRAATGRRMRLKSGRSVVRPRP
jgi:hypothetical protein